MAKTHDRSDAPRDGELMLATGVRVLILEAPYYPRISAALADGALGVLKRQDCEAERVAVPGALEIPQALQLVAEKGLIGGEKNARFAGAIALGCVIRGETSHYDIVCNTTNHWMMDVAIRHGIPIGNGVLTVDTEAQAVERAAGGTSRGKGADAARACLRLVWLKSNLGVPAGASQR